MKQKVFRTGHSLAVVVPSAFVKDLSIKPGDEVDVTADEPRGKLTYTFPSISQLPLAFPKS